MADTIDAHVIELLARAGGMTPSELITSLEAAGCDYDESIRVIQRAFDRNTVALSDGAKLVPTEAL